MRDSAASTLVFSKESRMEVEFKYNADEVSLDRFLSTVTKFNRYNNIELFSPSGRDYFFKNANNKKGFYRLRVDKNKKVAELTYKEKIMDNNSVSRFETDVGLSDEFIRDPDYLKKVKALLTPAGFQFVGFIEKKSFVVRTERFVYAHYSVITSNKVDYYIEIEARKDVFMDEKEALQAIKSEEERCLSILDLTENQRETRNLCEIYFGDK